MEDLFDRLDEIRRSGRRAVVGTLVATRGTSPRKEGARMWVDEAGGILGSVTIGGCVDAEVVRAAEQVLREGDARVLSVELGDEDAHALGLTCAGSVDVLVAPVDAGGAVESAARAHVQAGGRAVLVRLLPGAAVDSGGGPFVVFEDGQTAGTLGAAELDVEANVLALERLREGGARTLPLVARGEPIEAFFELLGPGPLLVIVGAGTIAESLTVFGRQLGMHVVLVDGRPRFASADRFPAAHEVCVGTPSQLVAERKYGPDSAIVVVAHDYKFDVPVLKEALATRAGYIGMLGSRRRAGGILALLEEDGVAAEELARIHTPIGLDIGAQSAAEIALSVMAEVVAVRHGRAGGTMRDRKREG